MEHYCLEHKQAWFKKGKMPVYAHPIKDKEGVTTGWCNEPVDKLDKPEPAKESTKEAPSNEQKPEIAPQERGMWWKEVGECFRAKLFNKDDGAAGTYLWKAYVKQMMSSLEITIPKSG